MLVGCGRDLKQVECPMLQLSRSDLPYIKEDFCLMDMKTGTVYIPKLHKKSAEQPSKAQEKNDEVAVGEWVPLVRFKRWYETILD